MASLLTNRHVNAEIDLGILDRLQHHRCLVTVGAVESKSGRYLGEELDVTRNIGLGGTASG